MSTASFVANLALTVLLLGAAVWAGRTGRRRPHFLFAGSAVLSLGLAIIQARIFGEAFVIPAERLRVHLVFAGTALLLLPGVALSGVALIARPGARRVHRAFVALFLGTTLAAIATALWMLAGSERIPDAVARVDAPAGVQTKGVAPGATAAWMRSSQGDGGGGQAAASSPASLGIGQAI